MHREKILGVAWTTDWSIKLLRVRYSRLSEKLNEREEIVVSEFDPVYYLSEIYWTDQLIKRALRT
jgi:hypothetical protein